MTQFNYGTYSYVHPLGTNINIYHTGNVSSVVNVSSLNLFINDINDNFKRYIPQLFSKLNLFIWDKNRSDIPKNTQQCNGISCWTELGIGNYAGLTYGWYDKIEINSLATGTDFDLAQILGHECGHYIHYLYNNGDTRNDIIYPEWERVRSKDSTSSTSSTELIAEDIRLLHGSRLARGHFRGDYRQANVVRGYGDMLLIWYPCVRYVREVLSGGGSLDWGSVSYKYSNTDFNYFGVQFCVVLPNSLGRKWVWCDRVGIWYWNYVSSVGTWKWELYKGF